MSRLNFLENKGAGNEGKISKALQEHFHVQLQTMQDAVTVSAMEKPKEFIAERSKALQGLYSETSPSAVAYNYAYNYYTTQLGLPSTEAESLALEAIDGILKTNSKAFDMKYAGGYDKAMGTVKTIQNARVATASTADAEIVKDAEYYKRKYQSKKQKYKSLKGR